MWIYLHTFVCVCVFVCEIYLKYNCIYSIIFNKKLVSFINDMCMKMFFALVNNAEKSTIFSENSKYFNRRQTILLLSFDYCTRFNKSCSGRIPELKYFQ